VSEASTRLLALDALVRIEDGAFANVVLPAMLRGSGLADRDRAFVTDLVYGTVRAERRLDDLVGRVARRPVRRLDPPVRAALRLGAYQLDQGVPPHAAVSQTVDAVGARSPRARGFVNASLRALSRLGPPWPAPPNEAVALSYPDDLVTALVEAVGADEAHAALAAMNAPPPVTLRVNPRRATPDAVAAEMRDAGADVEQGALVPDALLVRGIGDPAALPAVRDGRATPQDQASQAVVDLLAPSPGDTVADLAAAPGGKATAVAERVGDAGTVVALDVDRGRIRLVGDAAARLGLPRVCPVVADARAAPLRAGGCDRVLLDAPCSGLGALRRRPDARWRFDADAVPALAARQRDLLAAAAVFVRPGGVLVYSVCTLTREETVDVDAWAGDALPAFAPIAPPTEPWVACGRGALLLPQAAGTDGMYALALRRT
jgi:16S rRNA (cytosine967-C5)-methyltransferase